MDNDERSLFLDRLNDSVLEVHYLSEDGEHHEIECKLKEDNIWRYRPRGTREVVLNDITVWNVIDNDNRSFPFDSVKRYIMREWDENGDLTTDDYDFEVLINNTR